MPPGTLQMPTILIADDHPLVRLSVRDDLEQAGFLVCAEVATGLEAVEAAVREEPDLCLLDVSMPGGGLQAAGQIVQRVPSTKVVMLTASPSEEHVLEAVRVGAEGYLLKDLDTVRLAVALHDVLEDIPAFPRRLTRQLVLVAREALTARPDSR